jgi:hypothetical protein
VESEKGGRAAFERRKLFPFLSFSCCVPLDPKTPPPLLAPHSTSAAVLAQPRKRRGKGATSRAPLAQWIRALLSDEWEKAKVWSSTLQWRLDYFLLDVVSGRPAEAERIWWPGSGQEKKERNCLRLDRCPRVENVSVQKDPLFALYFSSFFCLWVARYKRQ